MATLVRTRVTAESSEIPARFPTELLDDIELESSLAAVQQTCLTTLANILSVSSSGCTTPETLVRALDARSDPPSDRLAVLARLRDLVDAIVPALGSLDARLAQAIVALLLDLRQPPPALAHLASLPTQPTSASPHDAIVSLQRRLSSLQPSASSSGSTPSPAEGLRTALFWVRIEEQLDTVISLCRARVSSQVLADADDVPPDYDDHHLYDRPPSYAQEIHISPPSNEKFPTEQNQYPPEKALPRTSLSSVCSSLDLDSITHAIERLYAVAPQLANQRVELRTEKIAQMENAKLGKGKARTLTDTVDPEFDNLLDLLGKASAREIPHQSAIIDPSRSAREKGPAHIEEQRRKYLEHIVHRTNAGRLHSQDAVPSLSRTNSSPSHVPEPEDAPAEGRDSRDSKRASYPTTIPCPAREPPLGRLRDRSLSAPHLSWLWSKDKPINPNSSTDSLCSITKVLSSDPNTLSPSAPPKSGRTLSQRLRRVSRPPSINGEDVSNGALDIAYVAEHHETLKHVLLFLAYASPSSSVSNGLPSAEVLPSNSTGTQGDCLFLRHAGTPSPPLALPVPVIPGPKTVLNRSGHWEVKATCYQNGGSPNDADDAALLPASHLVSLFPSSFTCNSCSLPLVLVPPPQYRDLPSEHWEELVDAWMCHPEGQTLAKTAMHGGDGANRFGFWPSPNEALVGGSYILFDAESVVGGNIKCAGSREKSGNTRLARCLCGAVLGRQHERKQEGGSVSRMYRLFKYAVRPVSATSQAPKIPMSAFVLQDMLEHVHAHATYRFVLSDDEDEKPRLLIWLFKPRLRVSYMLPTPVLLPKSGTINASKVLYKILGPASATSDFKEILGKYPGFPQAEYLFYPMDVCRQLAALLKESTTSYPEGMRTMTGLDVGWLSMT